MSANTAAGIPYPLPAEAISDYPAVAKSAAEKVPWIQRGSLSITVAANAVTGTTSLVYPTAFKRTATIVTTVMQRQWTAVLGTPSNTGVPIVACWTADTRAGAAVTVTIHWIAVDPAGSGN